MAYGGCQAAGGVGVNPVTHGSVTGLTVTLSLF